MRAPSPRRDGGLVALGEVMVRLDPGGGRIAITRAFQAWEAEARTTCHGVPSLLRPPYRDRRALAHDPVGRLIDDLMLQGVGQAQLVLRAGDGIGREARERAPLHRAWLRRPRRCRPRTGNSAASQLRRGDVDWGRIFGGEGARWFHGRRLLRIGASTPGLAIEAAEIARRHDAVVSYDFNCRPPSSRS